MWFTMGYAAACGVGTYLFRGSGLLFLAVRSRKTRRRFSAWFLDFAVLFIFCYSIIDTFAWNQEVADGLIMIQGIDDVSD